VSAIPETMKALVMHGKGLENVAVEAVPVPRPGPRQLLARVDAAGVCTSILKILAQGADHSYLNGWDPSQHPLILGDEGALTLVEVGGELADQYAPGQRFACQPAVDVAPVNHRERYRDNAEGMDKCAVGYTLGGTLAQYLLIQEEVLDGHCLLPLPDEAMPAFAVSMAEPIACVIGAHQRHVHIFQPTPISAREARLGILPGGVALVVGAGAMGRVHMELALAAKPRALVVSDLIVERLDLVRRQLGARAEQLGAQLVLVTPEELDAKLHEVSGGQGADDIVLAVGVQPVQQHALSLLARGGVANLFGGLPKGKHILELDAIAVHYRDIKVVGSSGGNPGDLAGALSAIASGRIDPGNFVAGVGGLENAPAVLQMIADAKIDGKAILYPHIQPTPLERVDHWSGDQEKAFVAERTEGTAS
jgi:L-sorbose 1-phosphate reductase